MIFLVLRTLIRPSESTLVSAHPILVPCSLLTFSHQNLRRALRSVWLLGEGGCSATGSYARGKETQENS